MNIYAEAIDALENFNGEWKDIIVELAKYHPSILVKLINGMPETTEAIYRRGIELARTEGKVTAIRYLRGELSLDLREAKKLIESITTVFR